jgi:hypothetical protein
MYVEDVDAVYQRAVDARWSIATRIEEVPEAELRRRVAAMAQGS